jgi:hypothetical protein
MSWFRTLPQNGIEVTPSDTGHLEQPSTVYVGGTGDVKVLTVGGQVITFVGALAGVVLPCVVTRVYSTGTDATSIVALY